MIDYSLNKTDEPSDDDILETAYNNAWLLFSGEKTFTEIAMSTNFAESYMPFDPYSIMEKEKFESTKENMLAWYIDYEDYEKCAFIRDFTYDKYVILMKPFDMDNEIIKKFK